MSIKKYLRHFYPIYRGYRYLLKYIGYPSKVSVLLFHEVKDLEVFGRHIEVLRKNFDFLNPEQFERYLEGQIQLSRNSLLVTFDDGYYSSYLAVQEVLEKYNIKAAFFISTNFIGLKEEDAYEFVKKQIQINLAADDKDFLPMTWQQVEQLHIQGHRIGSHTSTHKRLSTVHKPEVFLQELKESAQVIERTLGIQPTWFAYPFGDIKSIHALALSEIKKVYTYCFSGVRGLVSPKTSHFAIPRQSLALTEDIQLNQLLVLGGLDSYYFKARRELCHMDTRGETYV